MALLCFIPVQPIEREKMIPITIFNAIENGTHREKYDEWLYHRNVQVRLALARIDYKPEILINDKDIDVRRTVVMQHPEMLRQLLGRPDDVQLINSILDQQVDIPKDILEQHLSDMRKYADTAPTCDLEAKLEALNYETSAIELTMSPQQLYEIDSPLWARGLTLRKVFNVLTDDEYEWN